MHAVILQRADHLEPGAIADVREARIPVAAEVALQNPSVGSAIEHRAPCFELAHARRALPAHAAAPSASCSGTGPRASCQRNAHASCRGHPRSPSPRPRLLQPSPYGPCPAAICTRVQLSIRAPQLPWQHATQRRPRRSPAHRVEVFRIRSLCVAHFVRGSSPFCAMLSERTCIRSCGRIAQNGLDPPTMLNHNFFGGTVPTNLAERTGDWRGRQACKGLTTSRGAGGFARCGRRTARKCGPRASCGPARAERRFHDQMIRRSVRTPVATRRT